MIATANEWTETFKAGRRAVIRPIRRDDVERNKRFLDELSPPSKHFLFLGGIARLTDEALRKLCDPDSANDMAFVALDAGSQSRAATSRRLPLRGRGFRRRRRDLGRRRRRLAAFRARQAALAPPDRLRAGARREAPLFDGLDRRTRRMRKLARDMGFREKPDPDDASQVICYLDLAAGASDTPRAPK